MAINCWIGTLITVILLSLSSCSNQHKKITEGMNELSKMFNIDVQSLDCDISSRAHICSADINKKILLNNSYLKSKGLKSSISQTDSNSSLSKNICNIKFGDQYADLIFIRKPDLEEPSILIHADSHQACIKAKTYPGLKVLE